MVGKKHKILWFFYQILLDKMRLGALLMRQSGENLFE